MPKRNKKTSLKLKSMLEAWEGQSGEGFGTTICLGATKEQIQQIIEGVAREETSNDIDYYVVHDPTYPCIIPKEVAEHLSNIMDLSDQIIIKDSHGIFLRDEMVGAYIFGDKNNDNIQKHISHLSLYP